MSRTNLPLRLVGAALLVAAGVLHANLIPEYSRRPEYVQVLFGLNAAACVLLALALLVRDDARLWWAGVALQLLTILGFVLSRTVGLPDFKDDNWSEGLLAIVLEAGFVLVAMLRLRLRPAPAGRPAVR